MQEKRLVKKWYFVTIRPLQDSANPPRRELDIIPEFVYETPQSRSDERNIHLIWYSSPNPQNYNLWDFQQLIISSDEREILTESAFIAELIALPDEIQPQEFEQILQRLGFSRKQG